MNSQAQAMGTQLQKGFGIVEALVALYLFNTVILAALGLQNYSFRMANDAKLQFHARLLALDGAGRLYANFHNLNKSTNSIGNALGGVDWADWQYQVSQSLPQGVGEVKKQGQRGFQVVVRWQPEGTVMDSCSLEAKAGESCVVVEVMP